MATISAIDANNQPKDIWLLAEQEPVTIERDGVPKFQVISTDHYIAVPIEEYAPHMPAKRTPRFGCAREQFRGFDSAALLAVDISAELEGTE